MDKNYNVDDILAEIKRKKADRQSGGEYLSAPQQAAPPVRRELPSRSARPTANPMEDNRRDRQEFPFDAVSAQAGREDEALPEARPAKKMRTTMPQEKRAPRRSPSGLTDRPAQDMEQEESIPLPASRKSRTAKTPRTNWSSFDLTDEQEEQKQDTTRTRLDLPLLGRGLFADDDDDDDRVLGFGDATQELPTRTGRKLGRQAIQMDYGMDDEEEEPPRSRALARQQADLEPINDYNSQKDKAAIVADFIKIKKGLVIRLALSMILLIISLYLSFAAEIQALPLPEFMWPERSMRNFITVHTVVGVIAMLTCCNIVGAGLISLFKMQADTDTLPALAGIAAVVQGIVFLSRPEAAAEYSGTLLFSVSILCFLFNLLGKIMLSNRIARNFKLVSSDCVKYSMNLVDNKALLRALTHGITMESYEIAYPQPTKHLAAFLDNSYSEDQTDTIYRYLAPICLAGAFIMALVCFFASGKQILPAAHAFAAILAVCASFTSTLVVNLPLDRLSSLLTREGGMVSGYAAVEECSHLDGITLFDHDLIRPDNVVLHGIKTFDESRIDEIIVDAASVILSREGTLTSVFNQLIGGNTRMLRQVESCTFEDGLGLSAWVDGKQVLIGTREQLVHHGITPPPLDFERRFTSDGREVLYLSNAGQLCAMFVLSYRMDEDTLHLTDRLADEDMVLFVHTCDPNLTAEKLADLMDYPQELLRIFPADTHQAFAEQCVLRDKAPAAVGFMGRNMTMVKSVLGAISVKSSISLGLILQVFSILMGYGLLTFLSVRGEIAILSFTHLLLYQGIWAAIVLLIPNVRKLI